MDERIYPLTFTPVLQNYIWGGRRLETLYGRKLPPGKVAESWEIAAHAHGTTKAESGYWAGQELTAIFDQLGERLVGRRAEWALRRHKFPLLIKLLDAHQSLSVQVHPDDWYAEEHEQGDPGKTEMWYVLHAEPGAELILGLQPGVTPEDFRRALDAGTLSDLLHRVPVAAGQAIFVPTGTVHALLAGVVATEIQQNSDATYRVYDWDRTGDDGKPRPLHIDKAMDVINWGAASAGVVMPQVESQFAGATQSQLVSNPYFVIEELMLDAGASFPGSCDGETMEIWGCVAGHVSIKYRGGPATDLPTIRYALLPAALGDFDVVAREAATCLRVYLPAPA